MTQILDLTEWAMLPAVHTVAISKAVLRQEVSYLQSCIDSNSRVWGEMSRNNASYSSAMNAIAEETRTLRAEIGRLQSLPLQVEMPPEDDFDFDL